MSKGAAVAGGICAASALMAYAARGRSSSCFAPSVYRGSSSRPSVALTFDDGPSESTLAVLEILARCEARATFFQCGRNVERLPNVAREVRGAGHEIGNHSHTHPLLALRSPAVILDEFTHAQRSIADTTGAAP